MGKIRKGNMQKCQIFLLEAFSMFSYQVHSQSLSYCKYNQAYGRHLSARSTTDAAVVSVLLSLNI